jgi:hypothetical protein
MAMSRGSSLPGCAPEASAIATERRRGASVVSPAPPTCRLSAFRLGVIRVSGTFRGGYGNEGEMGRRRASVRRGRAMGIDTHDLFPSGQQRLLKAP